VGLPQPSRRRAKTRGCDTMISELRKQDDLLGNISKNNASAIYIPSNYDEAMISINKTDWIHAVGDEINSMEVEEVFTSVPLSDALREVPHESILGTKWLRLLFSTACLRCCKVRTFDVNVAFIHSLIDKPVYIWPPKGMNVPKHNVLKLKKALYGKKQASRCWWLYLKGILQKIGFTNNKEDPSTYTFNQGEDQAILWVHVDDGALTASLDTLLSWFTGKLDEHLKIKWDANVSGLIGISIKETCEGFKFWQPDLINKLTTLKPSMITAKTPSPMGCQLESDYSDNNMDKPYLKRICILLYIVQASQPDISYAVNYLARFSLRTNQSHWDALEHLISYMRGTRDMGILISKSNSSSDIKCFVDANWGGEGNRSTHGYIISHGLNPIGWQSKRQTTIASSTAQAEYMSLSHAAKEVLWL
ncbi:hypothetical protein O181_118977, partial [Austropuccinia psidii MF-1]|nr:hypothetical protein [Austropuccinia psidii MF-1]